jgi:putative hydrolase of the HAD superfamily
MRMPIEALVFDHDGVLADVDYRAAAAFFGRLLPISLGELSREWNRWLELARPQDSGGIRWDDFWDHVSDRLQLTPEVRRELKAFHYLSIFRAFPDARPALLEARQRGLRVAVLSNTPLVDLGEPLRHIGLADLVEVICNPLTTGTAKPAPEAYQRVLAALGLEASRCLFFDDEETHVTGAAAVGMEAWRVDRQRPEHALQQRVIRDLSALPLILSRPG